MSADAGQKQGVGGSAVTPPTDLPPGFIRPAHGNGMLRVAWPPGQSPNPGGRTGEYQATMALARKHSVEAMQTIINKLNSDDDRVALVAAQAILDRAWGKIRNHDPKDVQGGGVRMDFGRLTREELQLLLKITASGAIRPAEPSDDGTIDQHAPVGQPLPA